MVGGDCYRTIYVKLMISGAMAIAPYGQKELF